MASSQRIDPADFLIAQDGRVVASKYGTHADDQWSVDEVLTIAARLANEPPRVGPSPRRVWSARSDVSAAGT